MKSMFYINFRKEQIMPKMIYNGHFVEYDFTLEKWLYCDTKTDSKEEIRKCPCCDKYPTEKGHDACITDLPNVEFACCGHGVGKPYVKFYDGEYIEFENIDKLRRYFNI
jgi:hypothetical protein